MKQMQNKPEFYDDKDKINKKADRLLSCKRRQQLGIYIHIPFCVKKCNYCDFLSAPANDEIINDYINSLLTEIKSTAGRTDEYIVKTVFIGGGTPSVLEGAAIIKIMEQLGRVFKIDYEKLEASIEVNPGTVTHNKLKDYLRAGINRLSFGLQSANDNELKLLGRVHSFGQFLDNYDAARSLGYENINIDLMSALPNQSLASWEDSLKKVVLLEPEHISAYSLIIEEGTPFYQLYNENGPAFKLLPDEETERSMYHLTRSFLANHGYQRYEISNFAKPGYECRHNSFYWTGVEYLGFGLGASSLIKDVRFNNTEILKEYINKCSEYEKGKNFGYKRGACSGTDKAQSGLLADPIGLRKNISPLSLKDKMEEFAFLGLRMQKGISRKEFLKRFGTKIETLYGDVIDKHIKNGLLAADGDRIYLTEYGIDVSNYVLADFILN